MTNRTHSAKPTANLQRRRMLQGAAAMVAAGAVPVVSAGIDSANTDVNVTGKLICNIADPVKTLVLRNHSEKTLVLDHLSNSALMFDGSIVDCNNAFHSKPVSIPANQEVEIRFAKRPSQATDHRVEDYQRVQSRVTRLSDGTRVIPFTVNVQGTGATFV